MKYNWQQPDWLHFKYDLQPVTDALFQFAEECGQVNGLLKALPHNVQIETIIDTMVAEAIKTSEIEGEFLSRQDVVSSIRNNLNPQHSPVKVKDKKSKGAGELMVAVRNTFAEPLLQETLFAWHKMLLSQSRDLTVGAWRTHTAPMQVISGTFGREKVHFEAPSSVAVPEEMDRFIAWFNNTAPKAAAEIKIAPIRAAIAHLYFETIHPFDDGNGRIGRAIAEKALSQTICRPVLLSLSRTIEANKKSYYAALEKAQASNEITDWIVYFVNVVLTAQRQAGELIDFTLRKTKFFDRYKAQLNDRQLQVISEMLDAGIEGLTRRMTAKNYMRITKTSKATATRDLQMLGDLGVFASSGDGRSTHYLLIL